MSNNEDYNPFSNTHNPNNGSDSSQPFVGGSGSNPYMTPPEPSPYGPSNSSGQPYGSTGSAPAYQGPLNTPHYQYGGYGYNSGNTIQGNNSNAVASLILGILGITAILPLVGPILAIVLGTSAKKQIRASGQNGNSLATTGIVLGAIASIFTFIALLIFLVFILATY